MRLDEYLDYEVDEAAERRRLAAEKDYGILDHLETFQDRYDEVVDGDALVGSVSPSIFVGRSNYPNVSTGILSPVGREERAARFETSGEWYAGPACSTRRRAPISATLPSGATRAFTTPGTGSSAPSVK